MKRHLRDLALALVVLPAFLVYWCAAEAVDKLFGPEQSPDEKADRKPDAS